VIREAREDDLRAMQDIEVAACEAFRTIDMAAIADDAPPDLDELSPYQRDAGPGSRRIPVIDRSPTSSLTRWTSTPTSSR
jgi:hypothetical protein